jgi:Histidine kinase
MAFDPEWPDARLNYPKSALPQMFKPIANFLHRTPWWALFLLGLLTLVLLGVFTAPIRVIQLEKSGDSPEMNRAIKREIDSAFGESALSVAENIVKALEARSGDPARREELQRALEEIRTARGELRDAGREAKAAARDAQQAAKEAAIEVAMEARNAAKEAGRGLIEARKEAVLAMKEAGVTDEKALKSLDDSIKAAKEAERDAQNALQEARKSKKKDLSIDLGLGLRKDKSHLDIQLGDEAGDKPGVSISADAGAVDKKITIPVVPGLPEGTDKGESPAPKAPVVPLAPVEPVAPAAPLVPNAPSAAAAPVPPKAPAVIIAPLSPELRQQIRDKVTGDFYRIGVGAGMILLFIPLFVIAVIAKVFIDRARAAQRLAELKKKEAEFHNMNRQVTEAKLQALQAQVEPHFLYNTLANVQALTEADPQAAGQMVGHLIEYLRSALPKMRENTSTVGQEVELVRAYLNILKIRMGSRLDFAVDVPAELMTLSFPPLMLPSLVENAIKHGLEPLREGGRIDIVATRAGQTLRVTVRDSGKGLRDSGNSGSGVGLANIRERLQALYGDQGRLLLEGNLPGGVVATIEIPLGAAQPAGNALSAAAKAQAPAAARASMPSRVLAGVGKVHSVWTKVLSFTFLSAIVILAVLFGIGIVGISTGWLPVHVGATRLHGAEGMLVGSVGLLVAFSALVLVALLLVAVFYGLGVLFAALAVFIPVVILISLLPPLAPFILLGLVIYWIVRSKKRKNATETSASSSPGKSV